MKLSIVVAIYNLGERVVPCIESLKRELEGMDDVEALLIDDGSTDDTTWLVKKSMDDSPTIKYLRKENGGVSDARNFGLEHSAGEYIWFVDGDDALEECGVGRVISAIEENKGGGKSLLLISNKFFPIKLLM